MGSSRSNIITFGSLKKTKIKLEIVLSQNYSIMAKIQDKKILLMLINIVQAMIILLMSYLLLTMTEKKVEVVLSPVLSFFPPTASDTDWLTILPLLLCVGLILLLGWLLSHWKKSRNQGVCRYPWGKESLLREGGREGLWYFGPEE